MTLAAGQTGHLADHQEGVYVVVHGATAGTARPTLGSASTAPTCVLWEGSVEPTNAVNNDLWFDTTNSLLKVKVSGSFVTSGSGTYSKAASQATYAVRNQRTSGSVTLNNAGSWANVDTGIDIVLTAASGNFVEVGLSALFNNEAVSAFLDVATIVAGSPVNYLSNGGAGAGNGIQAWRGQSGVFMTAGGSVLYALQAGDISSGTVTLRLRYQTATATNKTLFATTTQPLIFWARNHG